ncbi:hypothetical protein AX15_003785 [Amanita polypyramis BW_CC]|nr:hypothetical protein AX15_003785 [Amanita polypyramis BW_CC]
MFADVEKRNRELSSLRIWVGLTGQKKASTPSIHQNKEKDLDKKTSDANNLPTKSRKRTPKWILFKVWFNTYRKFFVLTLGMNLIGLVLAAFGVWEYGDQNSSAIVTANFNIAVLMRNEIFQRVIYLVVNTLFAKWTPLWWRLGCTSVLQHLGGIHSGSAVSGLIWLVYKVVKNFMEKEIQHDAILVTGIFTLFIVGFSALSAFPWIRNNHHNVFERHHRFLGWLGVFSTWSFVLLSDMWNVETYTWTMKFSHLMHQQDFWFTLGITILVALPWCFVRKGLLGRISRSPVWEYHAFGIVSEGKDAEHHYLIAGVQGDFTKGLVEDPPKALWTRELKVLQDKEHPFTPS